MLDRPLSYWVAVARMGFQDDFNRLFEELGITQAELAKRVRKTASEAHISEAYVSKFLNGMAGNYELQTMAKWARAVGGIVQIRVIKEDGEAVRVVDYETARALDERAKDSAQLEEVQASSSSANNVRYVDFRSERSSTGSVEIGSASQGKTVSVEPLLFGGIHG